MLILLAAVVSGEAWAGERLFLLLKDGSVIRQYHISASGAALAREYTAEDFPNAFPAGSLKIEYGNILYLYSEKKDLLARLRYDGSSERLVNYTGDVGSPADAGGRILEKRPLEAAFIHMVANQYRDYFALDDQVFGISEDRVDRLFSQESSVPPLRADVALRVPGSRFAAAAVSPWKEVFISDPPHNTIHRFSIRKGVLVSKGVITSDKLNAPLLTSPSPGRLEWWFRKRCTSEKFGRPGWSSWYQLESFCESLQEL